MSLGKNIKQAREKMGLTQSELAQKIDKGFSTVQKYELDIISPPIDTIQKIAQELNVPIGILINLDPEQNYSIEHSQELIDSYFYAIKTWSEDKSFTPEETANIKEHFADLLLRYKLAINAISNIEMNSVELQNDLKLASQSDAKSLLSESKIREEYFKKYAEKELMDLKNWAGNLAWYIAKSREDKTPSEGE